MAETMDKKCFHDTFEVVEAPVVQGISLYGVDDTLPFKSKVLVYREEVEDWIDEKRTQVFPKEQYRIWNLGTQVLEHYC